MARAFGCARIQRHAGNRSRLFSLNLFPRTGRDSLRNRNRPARLHIGRRLESTRRKFAASTVAGVVSLANRKRFAADRTSDKPMTRDFIHEFVPGSSNRTLLLLHGTGGNERDLIPVGRELDPNAALLSPRGKVLENGMPRFFRRLAEGVFDLEDLQKRTHQLADFVAAAADRYDIDVKNLIAIGYSNGANIATSTLLLRPETFAGAILFRAMLPLEPQKPPELANVRVWIGAGNYDPIIPTSETKRLVQLLRHAGADVTVRFLNAGHALTPEDISLARDWLRGL